ncbi:MAG: hypothetical protein WD691_06975 [Acidimicrobiales bacterium]
MAERTVDRPTTGNQTQPAVGERFAKAVAAKDAAALRSLLHPDVDVRAMTPGRFWEATSAAEFIDEILLGMWFKPEHRIVDVVDITAGGVGTRPSVAYQFRMENPDGECLVEQRAYYECDGNQISWLRIICSGFVPAAPTPS